MLACLESGLCESHTVKICHRQFLAAVLCACGNNLSPNALLRFWVFCEFPEVPCQGIRGRVMSREDKGAANNDELIGRSAVITTRGVRNLVPHFLVRQPGFRIF